MSDKYLDKYRINSTRLQNWDYGWNAWYFVTIKTKNNGHYFGKIIDHEMIRSNIGDIAAKYWNEIPRHFDFVELSEFVVMPDHVHGLVHINKPKRDNCCQMGVVETRHCLVSTINNDSHIGKSRCRNPGNQNLSSIIGSYKSIVTRMAHKIDKSFAWQSRFYDKIVHDIYQLMHYEHYIKNNPAKWYK